MRANKSAMMASAPCKVILFGEHSVVYDKLGIAGTIERRIPISASFGKDGINIIQNSQYAGFRRSKEEVFGLLKKFREFYREKNFDEIKKLDFDDAIAVVAGEILDRYGYTDLDIEITLKESLKSIGQSAAIFSAMVVAVARLLGKELSKREISDIAYLGDVVAHGGTPSGIDTNTVVHGGYVRYRKSEGTEPLGIDFELPLIIVDSGEPSRNNVTVPHVRMLREQKPDYINPILDEMDKISCEAIGALKERDLKKIGALMNRNHELLKKLEVSTEKLDMLVGLGLENGALGAKLTAGGGGGCIIVLARDREHAEELKSIYEKANFRTFRTNLGAEGVRTEN